MVRYRVRPERLEEHLVLARAVYTELIERRPEGLRYATFREDDGCSFVHVAFSATTSEINPLSRLTAFGRFQQGIADRCESLPVVTVLHEVGSYRLLGMPAE